MGKNNMTTEERERSSMEKLCLAITKQPRECVLHEQMYEEHKQDRITNERQHREIIVKLDSIGERQAATKTRLNALDDWVAKISKAVFGNGSAGLVTQVAVGRIKIAFVYGILMFVASGLSAIFTHILLDMVGQ